VVFRDLCSCRNCRGSALIFSPSRMSTTSAARSISGERRTRSAKSGISDTGRLSTA
jgi:hypothetical protein